ncbi:MAG: hypothetical protein D6730_24405 [Bacteroidetes bacterium]|nr:MAG: hypothetical protein D6730_24405 [Bacteroidota bacterium]
MNRITISLLLLLSLGSLASAQPQLGLRFASNLNHFHRPQDNDLIRGWFSTGVLGVFVSSHKPRSGFELGVNVVYKNFDDKGFPNLPAVMQDFQKGQNAGLTAIEMDFKVGPRFRGINPKIGYILGYRFEAGGFQEPELQQINKLYLSLPFGASINLPTGFGTVGAGAYYVVGVTNVLKNPNPQNGQGFYSGGRMRAINLEIVVTYGLRK